MKEACELAGGTLVQKDGKLYCNVPPGTPESVKAGLATAFQPTAAVSYHDLTHPPQRPVVVRNQNFFHVLELTNVTFADFFLQTPAVYGIDGDFDNLGIKENMEIKGIRALIRPQSFQDVDSTYCTVMNQFTDAGWQLMVNREPKAHGIVLNIAPTIKWEPGSALNNYTTSLIPADFMWFRRELGSKLDKITVRNTDIVSVHLILPSAFTTKTGMKVGFQLACRPAILAGNV